MDKSLAKDALSSKTGILTEAIQLVKADSKNVRSGATKIIESLLNHNQPVVKNWAKKIKKKLDI